MELLTKGITFIYAHTKAIRRTTGILLLVIAAVMIFIGRDLESFESGRQAAAYYGAIFIFLMATLLVAIADLRAIRKEFQFRKKMLFVLTFTDEDVKRRIREKHPELFRDLD